jgi:hypothetical protein
MYKKITILCFTLFLNISLSQENSNYYQADPFYLIQAEQYNFDNVENMQTLDIRPLYNRVSKEKFHLSYKSFFIYNDNAPNLENTSDIWVGKGSNLFNSIHMDYSNSFLYFSIEPFAHISQNKHHITQFDGSNDGKYIILNDGTPFQKRPYSTISFRESQLYIHKNGFGFGISNANMWWGPGIHNSLNMTNNTTGFPHLMLGSISEQKWKNLGFNFRYYFTRFDKKNITQPFFTSILGSIRIYSKPIISLGLMRTFLSGGNISNENLSASDAMKLPFQSFFKSSLIIDNDFTNPRDDVNQTFSGYINMLFPESKLKIYLEYGWNDHRWDWHDFRAYPDHSSAICIGARKYGIFGKLDYLIGFEYFNNTFGRMYNNPSPAWYGKDFYHYSSYNGRRYTAHAGANSDDLIFYIGKNIDKSTFLLSFNYERHGLEKSLKTKENSGTLPEVKLEFKLDYNHRFKNYNFIIFYEFEYLENVGFEYLNSDLGLFYKDIPFRKSNVFGVGLEMDLGTLFNKLKLK